MRRINFAVLAGFLIVGSVYPAITVARETKEEKIKVYNVRKGQYEEVHTIKADPEALRKSLTKEQYHITQEAGTERPFTGTLLENKEKGVYQCVVCGTDLFHSDTKYKSGTGWPSFWKPVAEENIGTKVDKTLFMKRVEVHCPRCGAHLGHVFDDGPPPTHQRYCINSASLKFEATDKSGDND